MKIFRRKKNGKEVGTFYVRRPGGGRPISLALNGVPCTDAREANHRARLALKGKWPPAAVAAAKRAARAEHVPEDDHLDDSGPEETPKGGGGDTPSAAPPPSAPPVTPSPEPAGGADASGEPDPIAAAAAAAADAAGPADTATALPEDEEAKRAAFGREFAARFGSALPGQDLGISPGMLLAMAEWKLVGTLVARRAAKREPPEYLAVDPKSIAVTMQMLAMAFDEQLRRWGLDMAKVEPWMAIVGGTVGLLVACGMSTSATPPQPAQAAGGA